MAIDKGVAKLQGVEAKSPDVEVTLEGEVTLRDPLPASTVNAPRFMNRYTARYSRIACAAADDGSVKPGRAWRPT